MHKGGGEVRCELRSHGEYGWEVQLLRDGQFYAGRRFTLREDAVGHADELRRDLETNGWIR